MCRKIVRCADLLANVLFSYTKAFQIKQLYLIQFFRIRSSILFDFISCEKP
ncbi:hypothetical protein UYSO10_4514 [Kosakonia radicincitans]|nr:hypothetical protein UYSO10_4514 [Kosakonia radicincitans]